MEKYTLSNNKGIIISILIFILFCIFLYATNVSAASLSSSELGYNIMVDGQSSGTWNSYSSSNLSKTLSGINQKYLIAFNYRFTLNSYFQSNSYYELSYQLTNTYNEYNNNYTLKDNLEELGSNSFVPGCYFTSSGSYQNSASCFKSISTTITKINIGVVKITHTFIPKQNIYRVLFTNEDSNNPIYSTSGWSTTNIQYSVTEDSTAAAIIENGKKIDKTNDILEDTKDSITDDNIDDDLGNDFFNDFNDEDFGLSDIITLPLTTIQSLTSKTCSPLSVPIPFTEDEIELPCMSVIYENNFGTIYNLWKIVSFGIIAYAICIDIFKLVKGFKDPDNDKIEVLDL